MGRLAYGTLLEDKVSGFKGTVIGYAEYEFQEAQYYLKCTTPNQDGAFTMDWFNETRLKSVES
jgi:hypothetical protein